MKSLPNLQSRDHLVKAEYKQDKFGDLKVGRERDVAPPPAPPRGRTGNGGDTASRSDIFGDGLGGGWRQYGTGSSEPACKPAAFHGEFRGL